MGCQRVRRGVGAWHGFWELHMGFGCGQELGLGSGLELELELGSEVEIELALAR